MAKKAPESRKVKRWVPWEQFVRAWQASESIEEVCQGTGLKRSTVCARAGLARRNGVPLKRYPRSRPVKADWAALIELAKELES